MRKKYFPPLIGTRFGRYTVIGGPTKHGRWGMQHVACRCDCGSDRMVRVQALHVEPLPNCGCLRLERHRKRHTTHGESKTRLFNIWTGIVERCYSPSFGPGYAAYGGRGIQMCNAWRDSFVVFRDWALAHGYESSLVIDRIDNDGNYEPSNCRWVTIRQNSQNTRRSRHITAFGQTKTVSEWTDDARCRVRYATLLTRLDNGWAPEDAISRPPIDRILNLRCKTA